MFWRYIFLVIIYFTSILIARPQLSEMFIITLDANPSEEFLEYLEENPVGGVMLQGSYFANSDTVFKTINRLKVLSREPLLICIDQEGGRVNRIKKNITLFPSAETVGSHESNDYAEYIGYKKGKELKDIGINLILGPVADVSTNSENTVIGDRSFHTNPLVASELTRAYVNGIRKSGILPVIKHFPGHGHTVEDSHHRLPKLNDSKDVIMHRDILPFLNSMNASPFIMSSHILVPSIDKRFPVSISEKWLTDIVRTELDYKGFIITDDIAMKGVSSLFPPEIVAKKAILAGNDFILMTYPLSVVQTIQNYLESEREKDESFDQMIHEKTKRIRGLKKRYGALLK